MKTITITKQEELDALPKGFDEFTEIRINGVINLIPYHRENSSIVLLANSQVGVMRENSRVGEMRDNSRVGVMWANSQVGEMWDNSQVGVMWDNSQVRVMWANSQVRVMRANSQVGEMWDNSQVGVMWENSQVRVMSNNCVIHANHNAIVISQGCQPNISTSGHATLVYTIKTLHTVSTFVDMYGKDGAVTLYKVTRDNGTDHYTGKIKYTGVVTCPDFDPNPERECGGGLHLSPTPGLALQYNQGPVLECRVLPEDIVVYPHNITKVRCRKVEVIGPWKG